MIKPGKYLITGIAGTGKTTAAHTLRRRGFTAYGDEEEGLGRLEDQVTGQPFTPAEGQATDFSRYAWNFYEQRLGQVLASDSVVFIGGSTHNQYSLLRYFDSLFVLIIDTDTLRDHIIARAEANEGPNTYGERREEWERILSLHAEREQQALDHGAIAINSVQPPEKVADDILYHLTT